MNQKIFNSDESRIKYDLKLNRCRTWLRSADPYYGYSVGYINYYGTVNINCAIYDFSVLSVCMI